MPLRERVIRLVVVVLILLSSFPALTTSAGSLEHPHFQTEEPPATPTPAATATETVIATGTPAAAVTETVILSTTATSVLTSTAQLPPETPLATPVLSPTATAEMTATATLALPLPIEATVVPNQAGRTSFQIYLPLIFKVDGPQADFMGQPVLGPAPLSVTFVNSSTQATAYQWDFGDGTTATVINPTHIYTQAGVYTVTLVASDTLKGTGSVVSHTLVKTHYVTPFNLPTETATPSDNFIGTLSQFPSTGVLDTFNQDNGAIGSSWAGATWGYTIASGQLHNADGGPLYWNPVRLGADQEVYITLTTIEQAASEQNLLLKAQSDSVWEAGLIEVMYDPVGQRVQIWSYASGQEWVQWGADIPLILAHGDQFGARATATGQVEVYRNGTLLASRDVTGWPHYASSGYIGLWFIDAANAVLDDFGGGTVSTPPAPTADFAGVPVTGTAPLTVTFTNSSTHATAYEWNFGDSITSTVVSPTHTYTQGGIYTVSLMASGPSGSQTVIKSNHITITGPIMVRVIDTTGQTEAGVPVYAFNGTNYTGIKKTTDSSGVATFTLPLGDYRFRADKNGTKFWSGPANHCTVPGCATAVVTTSVPVTVTVVDITNQPEANLPVYAFNSMSYSGIKKTTDSSGVVTFTLPLGDYRFRADKNGTKFWSDMINHCTVPGCTTAVVTTSMPVVVSVIDTTGQAEVGLPVYAFDGTSYTGFKKLTDSSGVVTFTLSLGDYRFRADKNGTKFWSGPADHCAVPGCVSAVVTTSVPVAVSVIDTTGQAEAGLPVYAFNGTSYTGFKKLTDSSGVVTFTLPLGDYRFRADKNGTKFWSDVANHCAVPGCVSAVITTSIPVVVSVADTAGQAEAGLPVYAFNGTSYAGFKKLTDSSGVVTFTLPLGDYRFRADKNGTKFWSGPADHCAVPGCTVVTITLPGPVLPPVADFTAIPLMGVVPLSVTFTSSSTGNIEQYYWNFGDGITSTLSDPTHSYTQAGSYTVTLTVAGPGGTDILTRTHYITTTEPVVAAFAATPLTGTVPVTVTFVNSSTGASSYLWDFGDGSTSTVVSPTYTYTQAGIYSVALAVSGGLVTDTLTLTNYITTYGPVMADFAATPLTGTIPLTVTFTNSSTNATDYLWNFGDGVTQSLTSSFATTHTYTQAGVYSVTLTARNGLATEILTRPSYITITGPLTREWQPLTPTTSLSIIGEHAMAYDSARHKVVLYGGNTDGWPYADATWEFDGAGWIPVTTATSPTGRYGTGLAYDPLRQVLVLFGGSDETDTALNQTWEFTNLTWTQVSITGGVPPSRTYHSLAANPSTGTIYLFGGNNKETYYNDLWRYENGTWTELIANSNLPPARTLAALTYDPSSNRLLLFAGREVSGTLLADLWAFDPISATWQELDDGGGGPPARMAHSLTYDLATGDVILVGGTTDEGDSLLGDTWHYRAGWTEVAPATTLPARAYHQAVYGNNSIILFSNGEVWKYE